MKKLQVYSIPKRLARLCGPVRGTTSEKTRCSKKRPFKTARLRAHFPKAINSPSFMNLSLPSPSHLRYVPTPTLSSWQYPSQAALLSWLRRRSSRVFSCFLELPSLQNGWTQYLSNHPWQALTKGSSVLSPHKIPIDSTHLFSPLFLLANTHHQPKIHQSTIQSQVIHSDIITNSIYQTSQSV